MGHRPNSKTNKQKIFDLVVVDKDFLDLKTKTKTKNSNTLQRCIKARVVETNAPEFRSCIICQD